ncbi:MAG: BMP family ABC transporter substrate-binding protein [Desulfovibrio sp.]|nr:BMP family ABC transporter substrate-binding protein [Desulfovibrio sp.]
MPFLKKALSCLLCALLLSLFFLSKEGITSPNNKPLRVTLLLEHERTSIWNTLLIQGVQNAAKEFGLTCKIVIEEEEDKQEAVFQKEAKEADVLLVATDRFHEILRDNARRFPSVLFACIDAGIRGKNIRCITFADEKASFLAGAAAALFTQKNRKTNQKEAAIGWISGEDVAAMRSLFNGFQEGAKLAVPEIRVIQAVVGSFRGGKRARAEAQRLIQEGVTIIALAAGSGNEEILDEAKKAGIYVIGLDSDQKDSYPGHVLLSICKDIQGAVRTILRECATGSFQGAEIEIYDLGHGLSVTKPSESLGWKNEVLSQIERRLAELSHELKNGGIRLKSLRQKTLCNCL